MANMDRDSPGQRRRRGEQPLRSSSMVVPPPNSQVVDPVSSMFPGVVHDRARRKSIGIRQGSGSEKDSDAGSAILSRSFTRDKDEGGIDGVVPEVPDEESE